jgi:hypothetical protein
MDQAKYEQLLFEFLASGHGFFSWFQGKNTPNILMMMSQQLGAIEHAMKSSQKPQLVKEFAYLSETELSDLWATVQRHIAEGWQPYGSLVVGNAEGQTKYFQAVAKFQAEAITPHTPAA